MWIRIGQVSFDLGRRLAEWSVVLTWDIHDDLTLGSFDGRDELLMVGFHKRHVGRIHGFVGSHLYVYLSAMVTISVVLDVTSRIFSAALRTCGAAWQSKLRFSAELWAKVVHKTAPRGQAYSEERCCAARSLGLNR